MNSDNRGLRALLAVAAASALLSTLHLLASGARAADFNRGRLLYENHCTVCHTSVVHVREQRKADSRAEVMRYILRWQEELDLDWERAEVDDVLEYLSERYYEFESQG